MNIPALRDELVNDPEGIGYAGMSDAETADLLNSKTRAGRCVVLAVDVRRYVLMRGLWPSVQNVAANSTNPVHRGTAITILQTLAPNSFDEIRMNDPEVYSAVSAMLQTMVDAGAISQQNMAEMLAMGNAVISRAEEIGIGTVHHLDIAEARNG